MCFFLTHQGLFVYVVWFYQTTPCLAVFVDISVILNCNHGSKLIIYLESKCMSLRKYCSNNYQIVFAR